jgi:hypothetical protein
MLQSFIGLAFVAPRKAGTEYDRYRVPTADRKLY